MFANLKPENRKRSAPAAREDARSGVPPAPGDPFHNFTPTKALQNWDRERGFIPPVSANPVGDLYICWNTNALFLGLHSFDIVEPAYYRNASVPKIDRALWTVKSGSTELLTARVGSGREALYNNPAVRLENLSGLNLNVRNVAAVEIPARLLGKDHLKAGDTIELASEFVTHGRAYRVEWKGNFTLSAPVGQ
jgi:hypothetical protein